MPQLKKIHGGTALTPVFETLRAPVGSVLDLTSRFETFSLLPLLGQGLVSTRKYKVFHEFPNWHSPCKEIV